MADLSTITVNNTQYNIKDATARTNIANKMNNVTVTATDNGKVMMVVNGAWQASSLPLFNGEVV